MSDGNKDALQFDRAEFGAGAAPLTCSTCREAVPAFYYQVGDQVVCERCKADLDLARTRGSGIGRFARATTYGTLAGAVGAGIWYGVRVATGYEVGLIAVIVGLMVGGAVRAGSRGRGGWLYQSLAILLTYTAIVSNYVPDILKAMKQTAEQAEASGSRAAGAGKASADAPAPADTSAPPEQAAEAGAVAEEPAESVAQTSGAPEAPPSPGAALAMLTLFAVLVMLFAYAAPFLGGFENAIGILIIGFALYEAWKINRRVPLEVTGPYRVGATPAAGAPSGE